MLILQTSTATLPHDTPDRELTNKQTEQAKSDPGLDLLVSIKGIAIGVPTILVGTLTTLISISVAHETRSDTARRVNFGIVCPIGLGITYLGAKITWFYMKRAGQVLFPKDQQPAKN